MIKHIIFFLKLAILLVIGVFGVAFVDVGYENRSQLMILIGFVMNFYGFVTVGWMLRKHEENG